MRRGASGYAPGRNMGTRAIMPGHESGAGVFDCFVFADCGRGTGRVDAAQQAGGKHAISVAGGDGRAGLTAKLHDFSHRPPRIMLLVGIAFVGVYFGSYFSAAAKLIETPGLAWLIGLQVFRVAVEIFLFLGHRAGFVPVQMTFEGRNWDVLTGLTALPMAWLVKKNKAPKWLIYAWNTMGLALLLNVVIVAAVSLPTPLRHFHNEPANTFVAYFPYVWLPAYLVQVAWLGHLLIFRAAKAAERSLFDCGN